MKRVKLLIWAGLAGVMGLSACKKTQTVNAIDFLLTSKAWKPSATDLNTSVNPKVEKGGPTNAISSVKSCSTDDTYTFGAGEILTISHGKTHCEPNEPDVVTLNYSYDKPNSMITIDGVSYKVIELNDTELKYYTTVTGVNGASQNVIYIYQH